LTHFAPKGRRSLKSLVAWLLGALVALTPAAALAGQERYDYDGLGRLIRVIDEQGRVTEYVYDAAGNLLRVITGGTAQAPTVTSSSPASIRRGETKAVQIIGTGLTGAHVSTADAELDVSNLRATATQIDFNLTASTAAALGTRTIAVSNSAGSTSIPMTVNPVLPKLSMSPQPIAVPPTNAARSFFVSLSSPDNIPHTINLVSANTAIATVSPASITIAAGQTEVIVSVTGKAVGNTSINLTSPDLAGTSVPVFVTAEFSGITTSFAPLLGVVVTPAPGSTSTTFTPIVGPALGVVRGAYISDIVPNHFTIGTGPVDMVVRGNELGGVTGVTVSPPDGITLGAVSVAPDGKSVTVPVTVAANAPTTTRRVVLSGAQQPYAAARAGADYVLITTPVPQVDSLDPNFAVAGTTAMTLTVRGRNLQTTQAVSITPSTGITVSSTPSVSADGTTLTLAVSVSALAPTGPRTVTVTTAAGTSDAAASPANTFSVVNEVQAAFTPIVAPVVGVVKQEVAQPVSQTFSAFSSAVGVVVPPAVTGMTPAVGIIGTSVTLTLSGAGLAGVTAVQAIPPDGLTLGALNVAPDGTSVTLPVDIAAAAPQTVRTIRVLAGSTNIAFSNPASALFRVTAPLPQIDGMTQIYLQVGAPAVSLTLFGRNFQNASLVRVDPSAGMTVSPPTVNADATQATVTISAAAGAATGPRTVIIATPAGESSVTAVPANTINLVNTIQANFTPILAPSLGVVLESVAVPVSTTFSPIVSPNLGVVLQGVAPPVSTQFFAFGTALGVAVGPFANGVQAPPLFPTSSGTLTVSGMGLADVTAVQISPPDNITVGTLTMAPDGSQVQAPLSLAGAATGPRTVIVMRGAQRVTFMPAGSDVFRIATGAPSIDSLSPILASRGQTFTMTVRGQNFQGVTRVSATPGSGIFIDSLPAVNGAGTEITVQVSIAADAPLGSSVFRVFTPGGATTDAAAPANTFTVLE